MENSGRTLPIVSLNKELTSHSGSSAGPLQNVLPCVHGVHGLILWSSVLGPLFVTFFVFYLFYFFIVCVIWMCVPVEAMNLHWMSSSMALYLRYHGVSGHNSRISLGLFLHSWVVSFMPVSWCCLFLQSGFLMAHFLPVRSWAVTDKGFCVKCVPLSVDTRLLSKWLLETWFLLSVTNGRQERQGLL